MPSPLPEGRGIDKASDFHFPPRRGEAEWGIFFPPPPTPP